MRKIFILTLILLIPNTATAQESLKLEKIEKLMNYQGLLDAFKLQSSLGNKEAEAFAKDFLNQTMGSLKLDGEAKKLLDTAFSSYLRSLEGSWNPEDAVKKWGSLFGTQFSVDELEQLIDFYSSDIGQKEVKATQKVMGEFMNYFSQNSNNAIQQATEKYIQEVEKIMHGFAQDLKQ